jgi:hypothetical protein
MVAVSLIVGLAYAVFVAGTTPFTWAANAAIAVALAVAAVAAAWKWPRRTATVHTAPQIEHPYRSWVLLLAVIVAWELYSYLAPGSRAQHPTFSSMTDAVDRYEALKALVVLAWLSLGWMILRRGSGSAALP